VEILLLCYEYPPLGGGGGVGAQQYAEAWAAKGHRVTVLTSGASGLAATEVSNRVRIIRVFAFGRRNRATATLLAMLAYNLMGAMHLLLRRRDFAQIEVINGHFSIPTGPLAALAARLLQRPNVLTIIGGDIYDPSKRSSPHRNPLLRRVNRWLINDADRVIAISSDTKRRAEQWYGIARPIEIVNYGFRPSRADGEAPAPWNAQGFRLISVGRLVERKGFGHLVEALAMLPEDVELVLIGDGPCEGALKQLAAAKGVAARVAFLGYQTRAQIHRHLRQADCYVLSSLHEGLGIVVQEAMDAGLPVVATNNGGQVDLIREPRNGILIAPADPEALARAIATLYRDRALARRMGTHNRIDIGELDIEKNCERYLDIFRDVASTGRASVVCDAA
jgi:glycosyltransferase involved in cell wall biosynthesis